MTQALLLQTACAVALVLGLATVSPAQDESNTQRQAWPDVQVFVPTSPKTRLFFIASRSQERESRSQLDAQFGAHVDYLANEHVSFRVGYRYSTSLIPEDDFREHRIVAEQTLKTVLPGKVVASDRNRQDFRFIRGEYSFRYRNRLTLEREVAAGEYRFTPYLQGEAYFDSRFLTWNRHRYGAGVVLPLAKPAVATDPPPTSILHHLSLDVYYMRQNDSRSSPHHVNAAGLSLVVSF